MSARIGGGASVTSTSTSTSTNYSKTMHRSVCAISFSFPRVFAAGVARIPAHSFSIMIKILTGLRSSLKSSLIPALNRPSPRCLVAALPEGKGIPKIIHQTFYKTALPEALELNVTKLKKLNPDWEYRFYDDNGITSFITDNYPPSVLSYFNRIDGEYGAAKADLFRYLLMYKCGGVYLDIKSSANKPLDETFKKDDVYLLSFWKNGKGDEFEGWGRHKELSEFENGEFQQWYIACAPGHPFLKAVIEGVLRNIDSYNPVLHGVGKHGVLRVTGPVAYTLAIQRLISDVGHRFVDSRAELGFEYSVYSSKAHTNLFKSHYSVLTRPIVKLGHIQRQTARLLNGLQKTRHFLTKRLS
ncbi:glycosyltransferase family 32 protein [Noviherbaspirillum suwonense]|uniref:Glycosyltransferase sugar-binding region containing DXD motif-containing protein n=1 Tax=Noviherbaspirillum suwonense TaxID=1224511 RepID=A0ABY1QZC5_9BURK|nr:glycosyltransferase [Noviherbaspirillum suwonense]SMP82008.1 Glycosyltransferase sugar-binding region containing DXD motif-containing protein [Noviherbaspirillum suwonense]